MIGAEQDHSLDAMDIPSEQALNDLDALKVMTHSQHPEDQPKLEEIYLDYVNARKPDKCKKT